MHTVELLEQALSAAKRLGYQIRMEWFGGNGGGVCEFGGKKWLFVDLALNAWEQLDMVVEALRQEPAFSYAETSPGLHQMLASRKAA